MDKLRIVYWLYYSGEPITSVVGDKGLSENAIYDLAISQHRSVPLCGPLELPFEKELKIRKSRIVTYPPGPH